MIKSQKSANFVIITCILLTTLLTFAIAYPYPLDIYDDVSDFFEAVSLDDVTAKASVEPETFCRMPARKGVCRAIIQRFSYDAKKKDCFEFKFGGCDGNQNNFATYKQCMQTCQGM